MGFLDTFLHRVCRHLDKCLSSGTTVLNSYSMGFRTVLSSSAKAMISSTAQRSHAIMVLLLSPRKCILFLTNYAFRLNASCITMAALITSLEN